jgi:hypothetical protein
MRRDHVGKGRDVRAMPGEILGPTEESERYRRKSKALPPKVSRRRTAAWLLFCVLGILVFGVLAWAAPGVLVLLLVVALPLFVRMATSAAPRKDPRILHLIGITILVGVISLVACFGALNDYCSGPPACISPVAFPLAALGGAGFVAALIVGFKLFDRYRRED